MVSNISVSFGKTACDWLVFNSCDWRISILAVLVKCSRGLPLSYGCPIVVFLDRGLLGFRFSLSLFHGEADGRLLVVQTASAKKDGVVYRIPCECGKVYIGETGRSMQDLRSMTDSPVHRPLLFQSTPTTPDTTRFGMK